MNWELLDIQAGFRKGRGTRDQIASIHWILEKARELKKKKICFTDHTKAFDCVDHNKLWKIVKEMGILEHLTCLLRSLCAGQEATVRTGHGTTQGSGPISGKEYIKVIYCHPAYLISVQCTSCKMPSWMNHKTGIKIARRNISNLRYADDTTLMTESGKELKSLLMKVKEEWNAGLKLNIQRLRLWHPVPSLQGK